MNSVLFQPFLLHDLILANRIVLSPMTRGRAGAARLPNRLMAEYYAQRQFGGPAHHRGDHDLRGGQRLERVAGHLHRRDGRRLEAHHQHRA